MSRDSMLALAQQLTATGKYAAQSGFQLQSVTPLSMTWVEQN
jgi:hypothetical protein